MKLALPRQSEVVSSLVILILGLVSIANGGYQTELLWWVYLLLGGAALALLRRGNNRRLALALHWPLYLYLGMTVLALAWSVDRHQSLARVLGLAFYFLVYYLVATRLDRQRYPALLRLLLVIGGGLALLAVLQHLLLSAGRVQSTFINPNPLGAFMAMLLLAGLGLWLSGEQRRWLAPVLVLLGTSLVLSGSRAAMLAALVVLPLTWLLLAARGQRVRALVHLVLLGAAILATASLVTAAGPWLRSGASRPPVIQVGQQLLSGDRLEQVAVRQESLLGSSLQGRLAFWQVAAAMVRERPLTGFGPGTYHLVYASVRGEDRWYSRFAHNHYLQEAAETGIPAAASMALFLGLAFWRLGSIKGGGRRERQLRLSALAGALVFGLHIAVDFSWEMPAVTMLFFILLGTAAGLSRGVAIELSKAPRSHTWLALALAGLLLVVGAGQQLAAYGLAQVGLGWVERNQLERGAAWLEAAGRIYPLRPRYPSLLADIYNDLDRQQGGPWAERALAAAGRAAALSPYDHFYQSQAGRLLWQASRPQAEDYLARAALHGRYLPGPYADLGYYYLSQGQPAAAREALHQGLVWAPYAQANGEPVHEELVRLHLGLARAAEVLGQPGQARVELEQVLQLDPENEVARREMAKHTD